jgi:long-chain fatty acid transport protein
MRKWVFLSCAAAALLAAAGEAQAAGFAIREQSAEGQGSSFAGVAAGTNGLSSMFWNPATISQHNEQGYTSESNFSIIMPSSEADDGLGIGGDPESGNISKTGFVPAGYWTYGLTDEITIGMATGAPFGLATNADDWAGSWHGDESKVITFNINPNIAYQLNDMFTVAVGVQGQYMRVDLTSNTPAGVEFFDAQADDIAFGFTAGLLFEPTEDTSIGIGFRSSISHELEGDAALIAPPTLFDGDVSADFDTPETVTIGVRHRFDEALTVMAGVEWANWSRFETLEIVSDDTGAVIGSTPENWKDSWFFSLGAEYQVDEALMLRGGVAYENSGVPDATRTPRVPDNDRYWVSAGLSYKVTDWITANMAYSYVFVEDGDVNLAAGALPPLQATFEQNIHIFAAGATLDW